MLPNLAIKIAEGIYLWYQEGYNPPRLSDNMLSIFQKLKTGYDGKNTNEMMRVISDSYSGILYSTKSKYALLELFKEMFDSLPIGINPNLRINGYQRLEDSSEVFKAVIDFESKLTLLFIPFRGIDSGRLYIEVRPEEPYGIWKINKIDKIKD